MARLLSYYNKIQPLNIKEGLTWVEITKIARFGVFDNEVWATELNDEWYATAITKKQFSELIDILIRLRDQLTD